MNNAPFTLVDIGARGGVHPRWSMADGDLRAVLFEPEPAEYEKMRRKLPERFVLINAALSDQEREHELNVCRSPGSSSLYPPNTELLGRFPRSERFDVTAKVRLKTRSLDACLAEAGVADVDFIKIDVQGHEMNILKGAEASLRGVVGLEIEVEFAELYLGQCMFADVDVFMRARGFALADLRRCYWRRVHGPRWESELKGQLVFGDALYFRTPEALERDGLLTPGKTARAILAYLAYGLHDFAGQALGLAAERGVLDAQEREQLAGQIRRARLRSLWLSCPPVRWAGDLYASASRWLHGTHWYFGDRTMGNP